MAEVGLLPFARVALQVASWSNWVKAGAQEIIRALSIISSRMRIMSPVLSKTVS